MNNSIKPWNNLTQEELIDSLMYWFTSYNKMVHDSGNFYLISLLSDTNNLINLNFPLTPIIYSYTEKELEEFSNLVKSRTNEVYNIVIADLATLKAGPTIILNAIRQKRINEVLKMANNFDYESLECIRKFFWSLIPIQCKDNEISLNFVQLLNKSLIDTLSNDEKNMLLLDFKKSISDIKKNPLKR